MNRGTWIAERAVAPDAADGHLRQAGVLRDRDRGRNAREAFDRLHPPLLERRGREHGNARQASIERPRRRSSWRSPSHSRPVRTRQPRGRASRWSLLRRPRSVDGSNPLNAAVTRYRPAGSASTTYSPCSSAVTVRGAIRAAPVTVTGAPGSTLPAGSRTTPVSRPSGCPATTTPPTSAIRQTTRTMVSSARGTRAILVRSMTHAGRFPTLRLFKSEQPSRAGYDERRPAVWAGPGHHVLRCHLHNSPARCQVTRQA